MCRPRRYKAFDEESGLEVAWTQVKLRDVEAREKRALLHEVELMRRLDHPNIIHFCDSWTCASDDPDASPTLNFVTELCGCTLRECVPYTQSATHALGWAPECPV